MLKSSYKLEEGIGAGVDLGWGGGGGGADASFLSRIRPLPTQRIPLWCQFILILRGERAPKKLNFLVKNFQKVLKNAFFGPFFIKILPASQKFWPKQGLCSTLGELGKSIWST